jgi:uncharacterized protein YdaU (DUF1376 family)
VIWYKHYIGDFSRDTGHLSPLERGVYRDLIDHYYATEAPLPMDRTKLYRIAQAHTKDERAAVDAVLPFFSEFNGAYHHKRIDKEIKSAAARGEINRQVALAREATKRARIVDETFNESSTLGQRISEIRVHTKKKTGAGR